MLFDAAEKEKDATHLFLPSSPPRLDADSPHDRLLKPLLVIGIAGPALELARTGSGKTIPERNGAGAKTAAPQFMRKEDQGKDNKSGELQD
jgi:hypothetical protein